MTPEGTIFCGVPRCQVLFSNVLAPLEKASWLDPLVMGQLGEPYGREEGYNMI